MFYSWQKIVVTSSERKEPMRRQWIPCQKCGFPDHQEAWLGGCICVKVAHSETVVILPEAPPALPRKRVVKGCWHRVARAVAHEYKVPVESLLSKNKRLQYSFPRHITLYLLEAALGFNSARITRVWNTDPSTVRDALDHITRELEKYPQTRQRIECIRQSLSL